MAKEVAIEKRAKISQAQQYVLLAVLGASIFLGVAISLIFYFIKQISFNSEVIAEEEKSIVSYSNAIRDIGVCKKPKGSVYSDEELKNCRPDSIDVSSILLGSRSLYTSFIAPSNYKNNKLFIPPNYKIFTY